MLVSDDSFVSAVQSQQIYSAAAVAVNVLKVLPVLALSFALALLQTQTVNPVEMQPHPKLIMETVLAGQWHHSLRVFSVKLHVSRYILVPAAVTVSFLLHVCSPLTSLDLVCRNRR